METRIDREAVRLMAAEYTSADTGLRDERTAATLLALLERVEELEKLLVEVEWVTHYEIGERQYGVCPICYREGSEGHTPNCELVAALRSTASTEEKVDAR